MMKLKIDETIQLTQDLVRKSCAVNKADANPLSTLVLKKILNVERPVGLKAFDGDHQCTLVPEIPGITANLEVTVGWKILDGNYRHTETPEIREIKVNLEALVEQKVLDGPTPTTRTLRIDPQHGDR